MAHIPPIPVTQSCHYNTGNKHKHSHHVLEDQLNVASPTFVNEEMCVYIVNCSVSTN